ncbi:Sugar (and other) transporter-like protein 9 [Elsinoe fawcettii]|nr:Sugar (and other) transporter-like protein 9 [Elsinoe fawcettii]
MATPDSSVKQPFFGVRGGWLTFWIAVACSTDMLLFGYDQAVFSGVLVTQNFLETHDLVGPSRTNVLSTVAAIYNIGCLVGAIVAFTIGERLGRKKTILLGTSIMTMGAILCAASFSLAQMFVGRIILGIGNGLNTSTAPIWQTETAKSSWRGKLVIIEMMMNIAGFTLCNWINYALSFRPGSLAWRFPLAFQLIFIIVLLILVPVLPESPRWLISHERATEATVILGALENRDQDDAFVIAQGKEIQFSIDYDRRHNLKWRQLLSNRTNIPVEGGTKPLRRLLLGAGTQLIQQFQGANVMGYYLPTVLITSVGLSNERARLLTGLNATTFLILSFCSILFVDRWGRRVLMLISTAGQFLAFFVITILLSFADGSERGRKAATASIAFFFFFYVAFGVGMLSIPWLYPPEINSLPMRTKGAAVSTASNWLMNFVIVEITPIGIQNLGWRFWIVWTVLNAISLPIFYLFYPETANRSLEDMDDYYRHDPNVVVIKDNDAVSARRPTKYVTREKEQVDRTRDDEVAEEQMRTTHKVKLESIDI